MCVGGFEFGFVTCLVWVWYASGWGCVLLSFGLAVLLGFGCLVGFPCGWCLRLVVVWVLVLLVFLGGCWIVCRLRYYCVCELIVLLCKILWLCCGVISVLVICIAGWFV